MSIVFLPPEGDPFVFFDASAEAFGLASAPPDDPEIPRGSPADFAAVLTTEAPESEVARASGAPPGPVAPVSVDLAADLGDHDAARDAAADSDLDAIARGMGGKRKTFVMTRSAVRDDDAPSVLGFAGDGKAVVVIDSGWSPRYDQSNTVFSYDFSGRNDVNASVNSSESHGSWVAQTVTDVAADVDIIHLKVFDDWGRSASTSDIAEALRWTIANVAKYDIVAVNLSLGSGNAVLPTRTSLSDEFAALDKMGVFNIVAAGNSGAQYKTGVNVIAADPNAIAVSATDAANRFTSWTQKHATLTDIAALGESVEIEAVNGSRSWVSGTSFAAPYVAGVAARLQEATEELFGLGAKLDENELLGILRASGDRVVGAPKSWKGAVDADADAAVDWFLDHASAYADAVWV